MFTSMLQATSNIFVSMGQHDFWNFGAGHQAVEQQWGVQQQHRGHLLLPSTGQHLWLCTGPCLAMPTALEAILQLPDAP